MRNYREMGRNAIVGAAVFGASIAGAGEQAVNAENFGIYPNPKIEQAESQILYPDIVAQIPTKEAKVHRKIFPTQVTILTANIDKAQITAVNSTELENGMLTYPTPDSGLATNADQWGSFNNKIWIYGHSRFGGEKQLLYGLEDVKRGDEVNLDGLNIETGEKYNNLKFAVDKMYIADKKAITELIFSAHIPDEPTVFLLTSFRETGRPSNDFILNMEKLYDQVEAKFVEDPDSPENYIYLVVTAKFPPPQEDMLR